MPELLSTEDQIFIAEMFYQYSREYWKDFSIRSDDVDEELDKISMDYHGCNRDFIDERINYED